MVTKVWNGVTYDFDDLNKDDNRGYSELVQPGVSTGGVKVARFLAMIMDATFDSGVQLLSTSTTSITIGTGTHTFTMGTAVPFKAGAWVLVADTAAPTTNYMIGQVTTDVTASDVTILVPSGAAFGSGTITAWNIVNTGKIGPTGATGSFDINGLTEKSLPETDDEIAIYDTLGAANKKTSLDDVAIFLEVYSRMFI